MIEAQLECGHTAAVHEASSVWEFPFDPLWCSGCEAERLMSVAQMAAIRFEEVGR